MQLPLALGDGDAAGRPHPRRRRRSGMIFFLPYVLAEVAAGLIWRFVYDGDYGLLANDLAQRSAPTPPLCAGRSRPGRCTPILVVDRLEVLRLPHDALHRRACSRSTATSTRRRASTAPPRWQMLRLRHAAAARLDHPAFGVLRRARLAPALRPDHAADQGGPSDSTQTMVTFLYTFGVTRMRDRLRQRGRRGAVRHLRRLRLRLQADLDAP